MFIICLVRINGNIGFAYNVWLGLFGCMSATTLFIYCWGAFGGFYLKRLTVTVLAMMLNGLT